MPGVPRSLRDYIRFIEINPTHAVVEFYQDFEDNIISLELGRRVDEPAFLRRALIVWYPTVRIYDLWVPLRRDVETST